MPDNRLPRATLNQIDRAVSRYEADRVLYEKLAMTVYHLMFNHELLHGLFHSIRYRAKDVEHLREKLVRKAMEAREKDSKFAINEANIYQKITDLAGVRVLHLHTNQTRAINLALKSIFSQHSYKMIEGPIANTWDDEYREIFKKFKIQTVKKDSMYTSVHYVIREASGGKRNCEVQVRTLMEEVWGEVSHAVNYPKPSSSESCVEQLKVLARITSGCTRLVDSVFLSHVSHVASPRRRRNV